MLCVVAYALLLAAGSYDMPLYIRHSPLYTCPWPDSLERPSGLATARAADLRRPVQLLIHQDADANYEPLLNATRKRHAQYARKWGYEFNWDIGFASGWPYAAINRVWALSSAADRPGKFDWFAYVDADALVWEERCTFEDLIRNRSAAANAMLLCHDPMGKKTVEWHVNSGVFLANLRHPLTRPLACTWRRRLWWDAWRRQALPSRLYRRYVLRLPPQDFLDDQRVLQEILHEFMPRYPSLAQVVAEDVCTFNLLSGTLVRHVFGSRGRAGKLKAMQQALRVLRSAKRKNSAPCLSMRAGRGRAHGRAKTSSTTAVSSAK